MNPETFTTDEPDNPTAAAARELTRAGFALCKPLPDTKRPDMRGWSTFSVPPQNFGPGDLIGILGGPLSHANVPGHAVVVADLDADKALELADRHLPDTAMVDGRAGKPRSHRYFLVPLDSIPEWARSQAAAAAPAAEKVAEHPGPFKKSFDLPDDGGRAIDFIGTGGQVVCPPSPHPSGELREWEGGARGEPAVVPFPELWRAVCRLASACGCDPPSHVGWPWKEKPKAHPFRQRATRSHGDVVNRAVAYLQKIPGAVSGAKGHNATFYVARAIAYGFDLGADVAFDLLAEHYNPKCQPPWSDRELRHKCEDADDLPFGEPRGWLRDKDRPGWNVGWTCGPHSSPNRNGTSHNAGGEAGEDGPADDTEPDPIFDDTDLSNGRRFVADHGDGVLFVADMGLWFVFDGRRWHQDRAGVAVEQLAKQTVCVMAQDAAAALAEAAKQFQNATDKPAQKQAAEEMKKAERQLAHAKKSQDVRAYRRMLAAAQSEPAVCVPEAREKFDRPNDLLNCPNGTVELKTGTLRPHARGDYLTKLCPVDFRPDAPRSGYLTFLTTIFRGRPAVAEYVRRLSGYILTGETTVHATNFFHGIGANGKSVLVNSWTRVFGDEYTYTAPPELLMKDERGGRHPTEKAGLRGARLVLCSETDEDAALDEAKLKALSSSDAITARVMKGDFFTFSPTHKTVVSTNHKPRVKGTDHGIWRRLRLVPFEVRFWSQADKDADPAGSFDPALRAIPGLEDALFAEEAEGILADMVEHAAAFYAAGLTLTPPPEVTAATNEYRQAEDVVAQFVAAKVRTDNPGEGVTGANLYKAFKGWWESEGYPANRVTGPKKFGSAAQRILPSIKRSSVIYLVRIVEAEDGDTVPSSHWTQKARS